MHFTIISELNLGKKTCEMYVENLFSIIRANGAQRGNPDAGHFFAAFRQVMVDMVMIPSKGGNCDEYVDKFICTLENINKSTPRSLAPTPDEPSIMDIIPWSVKSILSVGTLPTKDEESLTYQETNVLAYIAGYIVHKIKGKVCSSRTEKLLGIADTNNLSHDLIEMKSYGGFYSGLLSCSSSNTETVLNPASTKIT